MKSRVCWMPALRMMQEREGYLFVIFYLFSFVFCQLVALVSDILWCIHERTDIL